MVAPLIAAGASVLLPILIRSGADILAEIVGKKSPAAAVVVKKVADALGTAATPEAIVEKYEAAPQAAADVIKTVQTSDEDYWRYLSGAAAAQAELFKREDERESFFSWGWRPAMSWQLIVLWLWAGLGQPVLNAVTGLAIAPMPFDSLVAYSGLWLAIYGGGHTIKSVLGK